MSLFSESSIFTKLKETLKPPEQKIPEVNFKSMNEFLVHLDKLELLATGSEAFVFLTSDKNNVIRVSEYAFDYDTLQQLIRSLKEKTSDSSKLAALDQMLHHLELGKNYLSSMTRDVDEKNREKGKVHNIVYKKDPSVTLPVLALLTLNEKAVATVMPYVDGTEMTYDEADAFDKEKNYEPTDGNPNNYRKGITNYPYDRVLLEVHGVEDKRNSNSVNYVA